MASYNILIVDDLPRNIQVLGKILSDEGFRVAFATNGPDALRLVGETRFDCILLDIMMPVMDGFEVCIELKKKPLSKDIPVIFLSAKNEQESVLKGFELGAQDYVTKPFNSAELIARVKTHIDLVEKSRELNNLNQHLEDKVRQRTTELELANRQLARLEQVKSDFLSIINHELRTPLTGITGLTGLLDQTDLDPEQKEYIQFLKQAAGRLARFSDIALLITSLQSKNQRFELFPISVNVLLEMAADGSIDMLKEKQIELNFQKYPPDTMIVCEADLLRKCIEIAVETLANQLPAKSLISLGYDLTESGPSIYVRDNGMGFSDELLNEYRNDLSKNIILAYEGIGLSLTAVCLIMRMQNGRVSLGNQEGGGSEIRLHFD
jgi:two-component system, sensor histidine kinase and response regulator